MASESYIEKGSRASFYGFASQQRRYYGGGGAGRESMTKLHKEKEEKDKEHGGEVFRRLQGDHTGPVSAEKFNSHSSQQWS